MKRNPHQLRLSTTWYRVDCGDFGAIDVQAATAAAARYQIFKRARDAGFFAGGFRDFLQRRWPAKLIRNSRAGALSAGKCGHPTSSSSASP